MSVRKHINLVQECPMYPLLHQSVSNLISIKVIELCCTQYSSKYMFDQLIFLTKRIMQLSYFPSK